MRLFRTVPILSVVVFCTIIEANVHAKGDVSVKAELSRHEVSAGETTDLQLKVTDAEVADVPKEIEVEGLQISYTGQSTQVQMVNYKVSSSVVYSYIVKPQRTGDFTIPSITVRSTAGVLKTTPLTLSVAADKNQENLPSIQQGIKSGKLAFGEIILPKIPIHANEKVPVEMRFYFDARYRVQIKGKVDFGSEGITMEVIPDPKESRENRDGVTYNILSFSTFFSVENPGNIEIEPASLKISITQPITSSQNKSTQQENTNPPVKYDFVVVKTDSLKLNVLPSGFPHIDNQTNSIPKLTAPTPWKGKLEELQSAVDQGDTTAAGIMAICLRTGIPKQDLNTSKELAQKAASAGNPYGAYVLARFYDTDLTLGKKGLSQKIYKQAFPYLLAAAADEQFAQYCIGNCYMYGWGVKKSQEEAVKWYKKAADQGNVFAETCLGSCYAYGEGVYQDVSEAAKWFKKAADQGDSSAKLMLSECNPIENTDQENIKRPAQQDSSSQISTNNSDNIQKMNHATPFDSLNQSVDNPQPYSSNQDVIVTSENSPKIKGLYIGMDIFDGAKVISDLIKTEVYVKLENSSYKTTTNSVSTSIKPGNITEYWTNAANSQPFLRTATDTGIHVAMIYFQKETSDTLFNAKDLSDEEFAKIFIDAYKIPKIERSDPPEVLSNGPHSALLYLYLAGYRDNRSWWRYLSPKGWTLFIADDHSVLIMKSVKATELNFN